MTITISSSGGTAEEAGAADFKIDEFAVDLDCTDAAGLAALEKKLDSSNAKGTDIVCKFTKDDKKIEVTCGDPNIKSSNKE